MEEKVSLDVDQLRQVTGMSVAYLSRLSGLSRTTLTNMRSNSKVKRSTAATLLNAIHNDRVSGEVKKFIASKSATLGIKVYQNEHSGFEQVCRELLEMIREIEKYSNKDQGARNAIPVLQGQYDKWRVLSFHLLLIQQRLLKYEKALTEKSIDFDLLLEDYAKNPTYRKMFENIRIQSRLFTSTDGE